jgi:hypothetical protein
MFLWGLLCPLAAWHVEAVLSELLSPHARACAARLWKQGQQALGQQALGQQLSAGTGDQTRGWASVG